MKQGAINAAYKAWSKGLAYSDNNFKNLEVYMIEALDTYNTDKKSNIEWDSIKENVIEKIIKINKKINGVR